LADANDVSQVKGIFEVGDGGALPTSFFKI